MKCIHQFYLLSPPQAIIEEADARRTEMKKEAYEFERDILKGALNVRTKKIVAEKCLRFFEEKSRARVSLISFFYLLAAFIHFPCSSHSTISRHLHPIHLMPLVVVMSGIEFAAERTVGVQIGTARKVRHAGHARGLVNQHRAGTISHGMLTDMFWGGGNLTTDGHVQSAVMVTQTINPNSF